MELTATQLEDQRPPPTPAAPGVLVGESTIPPAPRTLPHIVQFVRLPPAVHTPAPFPPFPPSAQVSRVIECVSIAAPASAVPGEQTGRDYCRCCGRNACPIAPISSGTHRDNRQASTSVPGPIALEHAVRERPGVAECATTCSPVSAKGTRRAIGSAAVTCRVSDEFTRTYRRRAESRSIEAAAIPAVTPTIGARSACAGCIPQDRTGPKLRRPPSVPMVIYALIADESVGKLFLGSLIPGIMIGLLMIGITIIISYLKKYPREEIKLTGMEIVIRIRQSLVALIMPLFVIGAVVAGIATATESAGIGVLYALIVGLFLFKGFSLKQVPSLIRNSIQTSANVMIIIALSKLYIWILAIEKVPQMLSLFMGGLDSPVWVILIVVNLVILLTGTFVDVSPAILLLAPVLLPSMAVIGVSSIQFGVLLIAGLAVGLVTPPVGMCLNVASAISGLKITTIFKAAVPFLLANIITLLAISFFPQVTLWLPGLLMK